MTDIVTNTDVVAMVTELFDVIIVGVGCLVNVGNVTFGDDEFNCDKRLVEATSVVTLDDTANEEVLVTSVLFICGVEGIRTVTFDTGVVTTTELIT